MGGGLTKSHPFLYVLPSLIVILFIVAGPLVYAVFISFFKYELYLPEQRTFIGAGNYVAVLTDARFYNSLLTTAFFTAATYSIEFVIGFGLAIVLATGIRGHTVMRTLYLMPMMFPPVVVGLLWRLMLNPELGIVNYLFGLVGIPPSLWLASPETALWAVILANVWEWTPFTFMILLAGLVALPREPFEAAKIDGASRFQTFRHLTFPMMRTVIMIAAVLRIMQAFQVFDVIYVTTRGGPADVTRVLSLDAYMNVFLFYHVAYAAAYTQMIFMVVSVIAIFFIGRAWPKK